MSRGHAFNLPLVAEKTMTMTLKKTLASAVFGTALLQIPAGASSIYELDPLHVSGDLLNSSVDRLPASATVLSSGTLETTGSYHFEDLMGRIPNLNWAGGTSRPRFFQIRGIGENSQFGNEIPASSVGFIIDGIDFTGISGVANLFDASQVEVLRGPQAAAFGANAMAGMVIVKTAPTNGEANGKFEASAGTDGLYSFGIAQGGSLSNDALSYRFSIHRHEENGFRTNSFLDSDTTNARKEWSSQFKLDWAASSRLSFKLNLMFFDYDNGYDAWALDNESFHTSTDEPGEDDQKTAAAGIQAIYQLTDSIDLSYNISLTDSDLVYSYDWDWSNPEELMADYGDEVYWGTDVTERTRDVWSHDLRFSSSDRDETRIDWAAGLYYREFEEKQAYFGIDSDYGTTTTAFYGQARVTFDNRLALTLAGRIEEYEIDFASVNPWTEGDPLITRLDGKEHPWGGKVALEYTPSQQHLFYASIDRGYKAAGINLDDEVPMDFRVYGSESLVNYELGWRGFYLDNKLRAQVTCFYMDRRDIQVDSSVQLGDGNTFALYKDNAASGHNYGVEFEATWKLSDNLEIFASLGLLETRFDDYSYIDPADSQTRVSLNGEEQAYAPGYTYSAGAVYKHGNGLFASLSVEGKDSYLFDVLNQQTLSAYTLVDLRLGYEMDGWEYIIWINNAFDENYDVRGFYFANEPPYYDSPKKWVSQGAPRQLGLTIRKRF